MVSFGAVAIASPPRVWASDAGTPPASRLAAPRLKRGVRVPPASLHECKRRDCRIVLAGNARVFATPFAKLCGRARERPKKARLAVGAVVAAFAAGGGRDAPGAEGGSTETGLHTRRASRTRLRHRRAGGAVMPARAHLRLACVAHSQPSAEGAGEEWRVQLLHADWPCSSWYEPPGHASHEAACSVAEKLPRAHGVSWVLPKGHARPTAQTRHSSLCSSISPSPVVPGGQLISAGAPNGQYVPLSQGCGSVVMAGQWWPGVAAQEARAPAGQGREHCGPVCSTAEVPPTKPAEHA
eukprot:744750-Prymnesium_polylepis.3